MVGMATEERGGEICGWHGNRGKRERYMWLAWQQRKEGERSGVGMVEEGRGRELSGWHGSRRKRERGLWLAW